MTSRANPQALVIQALELSRQSDWYAALAAALAGEAERLTCEATELTGQSASLETFKRALSHGGVWDEDFAALGRPLLRSLS